MNANNSTSFYDYDILIIGSGAAGLTLALKSAAFAKVAVISKGQLSQGATYYAQGGIAAVLDDEDSVESHIADTLDAGSGLCHIDMVSHIVENSGECVRWLVEQGVPFSTIAPEEAKNGPAREPLQPDNLAPLHLTQEGGHSHRRIIRQSSGTSPRHHAVRKQDGHRSDHQDQTWPRGRAVYRGIYLQSSNGSC